MNTQKITLQEKYEASTRAVKMLDTATPILKKLKTEMSPNYKIARQAFYEQLIPIVKKYELENYRDYTAAEQKFTKELGILTGIPYWKYSV